MIEPDSVARIAPMDRSSRAAIAFIVFLAAALRLVALDRVPPAICQDEAVNACDRRA